MKTSNPPFTTPSHDQITQRARELWLARGSPEGQDVEIWVEAERQLAFAVKAGKSPGKPSRNGRNSQKTSRPNRKATDTDIDDDALAEGLARVGKPARPSPTSLSL